MAMNYVELFVSTYFDGQLFYRLRKIKQKRVYRFCVGSSRSSHEIVVSSSKLLIEGR